jgi:hypothetical protein
MRRQAAKYNIVLIAELNDVCGFVGVESVLHQKTRSLACTVFG